MIELLNLWQLQSESVAAEQNLNSLLVVYLILSVIINRPVLLLAYFSSEMLFQLSLFDTLPEWHLYAIEFIIYTYVFTSLRSIKSKYACSIIIAWAIYFIFDAYVYGDEGEYGGYETILYKSIESIFTCAHLILICSLVPFARIRNNLRSFINSVSHHAVNSDYMFIYCYNVNKAIK